jgi:hypothetical protein
MTAVMMIAVVTADITDVIDLSTANSRQSTEKSLVSNARKTFY